MTPINVALVGAGFIGPIHVEALRRLRIPVTGVLGSSEASSRRAAQALGIPRAYRSFEELIGDPTIGAVHITAPNHLHAVMAKAALEAGKHVMCEKPLATTAAEAAELVAVARRTGRAAGVTYNVRFYPQVAEARARAQGGALGEPLSVVGSYVQDWLLYPTDYNWRVLASEGGGLRAIADIGTHWLDLAQHVVGHEVEAVCADLHTVHAHRQRPRGEVQTFTRETGQPAAEAQSVPITTEDAGAVLLRFRGGARGVLWVSQVTAGRKNSLRFEIGGTRSALAWNSEEPEQLWIGHRDRPNEILLRDPGLLSPDARALTAHPGGHAEGFADTFKQCFGAFYGAIHGGRLADPPFPTFEDGHRELVLCEAILRSHRERRWIEIGGRP